MPGGRHHFEFAGKEPLVFWATFSLLFANTVLMLTVDFLGKYFFPNHVPEIVTWYSDRSIAIQFILLALLAVIFIVFRKRVRYYRTDSQ
jgi:hypothetical protein